MSISEKFSDAWYWHKGKIITATITAVLTAQTVSCGHEQNDAMDLRRVHAINSNGGKLVYTIKNPHLVQALYPSGLELNYNLDARLVSTHRTDTETKTQPLPKGVMSSTVSVTVTTGIARFESQPENVASMFQAACEHTKGKENLESPSYLPNYTGSYEEAKEDTGIFYQEYCSPGQGL